MFFSASQILEEGEEGLGMRLLKVYYWHKF